MSNVVSITGDPFDIHTCYIDDEPRADVIRALEHALELARSGQVAAVAVTMLSHHNVPSDILSTMPENVMALAGAVATTHLHILDVVSFETFGEERNGA